MPTWKYPFLKGLYQGSSRVSFWKVRWWAPRGSGMIGLASCRVSGYRTEGFVPSRSHQRKWFVEVTFEGAKMVTEGKGKEQCALVTIPSCWQKVWVLYKNKALRISSSFFSAHFFKIVFKNSGLQPAAGACILNVKPNPKFQIYTSSKTMEGFP